MEDERFYKHHGFDLKEQHALFSTISDEMFKASSTITQQVVKIIITTMNVHL